MLIEGTAAHISTGSNIFYIDCIEANLADQVNKCGSNRRFSPDKADIGLISIVSHGLCSILYTEA